MNQFRTFSFHRLLVGAMAVFNAVYPVAASASQYLQMVPVPDLIVQNGASLPRSNVDATNTSSTSVRAGNAMLKVAPSLIDYGSVDAGKQAAFRTLTLTNLGSGSAGLGHLSVGKQFSVTNNCDGVVLPSLGTCQVNVNFYPTEVGLAVQDFVRIPFSSGTSSAEAFVELHGRAVLPATGVQAGALGGFSSGASGSGGMDGNTAYLAFPLAIINQQSWTQSFDLSSTGDAPLTFSGLNFVGNDGSFAASSNCPARVDPGQHCTVSVTFAPLVKGSKAATLNVGTSSFNGNVLPVTLTGEAIEVYPVYGPASTSSIAFGNLIQGDADVIRTATIFNVGTAAMNVTSLTLSGTNTTGLSIVSTGTCASPIAVGQSCTATLKLSGAVSSPSPVSAHLVVSHDGRLSPSSPVNIPLSGSVVAQTRVLSFPVSLDFGAVDINVAKTRTLSVSNTGNSPVTGVSATTSSPFSLSNNGCTGVTLLAQGGNSCTLTFSVTSPTVAPQNVSATLSATALTSAPAAVSLSASLQTRTLAAITPATLAFGLSPSHLWSGTQTVTVTNSGSVRIAPVVAGRDAVLNTIAGSTWARISTDTCTAGIDPGQSCTLGVQVQPPTSVPYNATVTVYPDAGFTSNAKTFAVSATGTPQSYTASVSSLDYGTVGSLQSKDVTVTFTNTSLPGTVVTGLSYTAPVATPAGAGAFTLTANTCGSGIPSQGTCAMTWRFTASSYPSATPLPVSASFSHYFAGARLSATVYPVTINLVGSGITLTPPASQDFGNLPSGLDPASVPRKLVTVTNTGAYPVTFKTVTLLNSPLGLSRDQGVANSCVDNTSLASGASCTVALYVTVGHYAATGATTSTAAISVFGINNAVIPVGASLVFTGVVMPVTASASVTALDFGTVGERTSVSRVFTYQLTHGGTSYISQVATFGTGYTVSVSGCPMGGPSYQGPTAVCTATVTYSPGVFTAIGPMTGTFKVIAYSNQVGTEVVSVPLTAQVQPATFSVPLNDLAFGDVPAQTSSALRYAVVKNTSTLAVVQVVTPIATPSSFTRYAGAATYSYAGETLSNCYHVKGVLAAGESCYVALSLSGTTGASGGLGSVSVAGTMATTAAIGAVSLPFSANFLSADAQLSATSVVFANPTPSTTTHSPDMTVAVLNPGGGRMYWGGALTSNGNFFIVQSNNATTQAINGTGTNLSSRCELNTYLEPGQSCTVTLRFIPQGAAGARVGTFSVQTLNPLSRTLVVNLSGTAQAGSVYLSQASMNLGSVLVGDTTTQTFVIGNGGDSALGLQSFLRNQTNGTGAAYPTELTAAHNCPASLAPGAECFVNITFAPDQNLDWGTLGVREAFSFQSFTNGAWTTTSVPLSGVGYGSILTASQHTHNLGFVETTIVPKDYLNTVTFTASGPAPVRINALTFGTFTQLETYAGGTCVSGLTLTPGTSCTLNVRNRADFSGRGTGVFSTLDSLFDINGTYYKDGSTVQANKTVQLLATGTYAPAVTLTEANPRGVNNNVSSAIALVGANFRSGASVALDGQPLATTYVSATQLAVTVPSGLAVGARTFTVRNTDGRNVALTTALAVTAGATLTSTTQDVYTTAADRPTAVATVTDALTLPDGRSMFVGPSGVLHLQSSTGTTLATQLVAFVGSQTPGIALAMDGNILTVAYLDGTRHNNSCCWYDFRGYVGYRTYSVGASSLTLISSTERTLYTANSIYNAYAPPNMYAQRLSLSSHNGSALITYQYSGAYLSGNPQTIMVSGTTWGTPLELPAVTGDPSANGAALLGTDAYVRMGDRVYSLSVSGTSVSGGTLSYQFTPALGTDATKGLGYNANTGALFTSCYSGTAVCAIPVNGSAMGAPEIIAGAAGVSGYVDGSFQTARFNLASVTTAANGDVLVRQTSIPNALRIVKAVASSAAAAQTSTNALSFTTVNVGSSGSSSVILSNTGYSPLSFTSAPAVTGNSAFSATGTTCGASLDPGASCSTTVRFSPTDAAPATGTLTFATNVGPAVVSLTGTGVAVLAFQVSAATLAFGAVDVNASSTLAFSVNNSGNVPLTAPVITGVGEGYSVVHNCAASQAPATSCTVTVTLAPSALGSYPGSVSVGFTGTSAQGVVLSGTGQGALLGADAATLDFGAVNYGSSMVRTTVISNTGTLNAVLSYSGLPGDVTRSGTCGASLAIAQSCSVTLTYAPLSASSMASTLTLSTPSSSALTLNLLGTGVANPSFALTGMLDFGNVDVLSTETQTVRVTNNGNVELTTPAITVSGAPEYSAAHNCGATLSAGSYCDVSVTFAPAIPGATGTASLAIGYAQVLTQTTPITGTGVANPSFVRDYSGVDFGNVYVGGSATFDVHMTNTGNVTLGSVSVAVAGTGYSEANNCGASLSVAQSCTVTVTFAPTSVGPLVPGTLTLSAAGVPSQDTALTGQPAQ